MSTTTRKDVRAIHHLIAMACALKWLEENCQPHEWRHAAPAFDGDTEAALSLSVSLRNELRGAVAVAMWRAKVPRPAYRVFLRSTWMHNHREVEAAAQNRRTLAYMFRYAAFEPPAELPDVVTLWRGTSYLPIEDAQKGYSWTTDRDMACWFSMRFAEFNGSPLVLTANVSKHEIAMFTNERSESEVLLLRPPTASIDGNASDWSYWHQRKQKAMDTDRKDFLNSVPPPCLHLASGRADHGL